MVTSVFVQSVGVVPKQRTSVASCTWGMCCNGYINSEVSGGPLNDLYGTPAGRGGTGPSSSQNNHRYLEDNHLLRASRDRQLLTGTATLLHGVNFTPL